MNEQDIIKADAFVQLLIIELKVVIYNLKKVLTTL